MTTKKPPGRRPRRPNSEACAMLRDLLQRQPVELIAMLLECQPETVRAYARGIRRPHPLLRKRLEPMGIPTDAWKATPTLDPSAQPPVGAA